MAIVITDEYEPNEAYESRKELLALGGTFDWRNECILGLVIDELLRLGFHVTLNFGSLRDVLDVLAHVRVQQDKRSGVLRAHLILESVQDVTGWRTTIITKSTVILDPTRLPANSEIARLISDALQSAEFQRYVRTLKRPTRGEQVERERETCGCHCVDWEDPEKPHDELCADYLKPGPQWPE